MEEIESLDLIPNDKNLKKTLEQDKIERNGSILKFISVLNKIRGHYSLALDGEWGSGKTFFVKQTQMLLNDKEEFNKISSKLLYDGAFPNIRALYYDAWENDDEDNPMSSLVYNIELQTSILPTVDIKDVISFAEIAADTVFKIDTEKLINKFEKNVNGEKKLGIDNGKVENKKNITNFLNTVVKASGSDKIVIFIDELDRCKPSFAVKLLEQIKHYFTNENIIYVFSIDILELRKTIEHFYGNGFDGEHYLDRFFDNKFFLPAIDKEKYWHSGYIDINTKNYNYYMTCDSVINYFNFSIREIDHFRTNAEEILNFELPSVDNRIEKLIKNYLAPIALGLKMASIEKYNKFITGKGIDEYNIMMDPIKENLLNEIDVLKPNETYGPETMAKAMKKRQVNSQDILTDFYNIIFNDKKYRFDKSNIEKAIVKENRMVGTLKIPKEIKLLLIRMINLVN